MIVGNGLIANAFNDIDDVIVFASGVSNSTERRQEEFDREVALFRAMPKHSFMVYFSTTSVYEQPTPYTRHKLLMEGLVANRRGLVIRLPQVAGKSNNPYTLLNYLYEKIASEKYFVVWSRAIRRIIDIDDIVPVAERHIGLMRPGVVNYTTKPTTVLEIVRTLEGVTGKRGRFRIMDKGGACSVTGVHINSNLMKIIEKYYGNP